MVDPDVKPLVCVVARRNSRKLMIGCFIPFLVQVRVGVNLDAADARRLKILISTLSSFLIFSSRRK